MSHSRPLRAQRVARTRGTARQTPCPGLTPFSGQPGPGPLGAYGPYAPLRGAPIRHPAPPHPPARPPPTPRAHPRAPCPAPARPDTTAPDLPTGRLPRTAGRVPGGAVPRRGGRGDGPLPGHGLRPRRIGRKKERPKRPGGPGTAGRGPHRSKEQGALDPWRRLGAPRASVAAATSATACVVACDAGARPRQGPPSGTPRTPLTPLTPAAPIPPSRCARTPTGRRRSRSRRSASGAPAR